MEHLEIEFKMLLKENIFKKILSDYKNQIKDSYQQTNYYLFHPLLEKKKYSLRIREKKGHYELTLKRPSTIGLNELNIDINKEIKDAIFNHQHINNEIFDILEKENIDKYYETLKKIFGGRNSIATQFVDLDTIKKCDPKIDNKRGKESIFLNIQDAISFRS